MFSGKEVIDKKSLVRRIFLFYESTQKLSIQNSDKSKNRYDQFKMLDYAE